MQLEVRKLLEDIRLAGAKTERFVQGRTRSDYLEDEMLQSAVERQFEIIGEAVNRLTRLAPDSAERIPDIPRIVAFRNILAHGYDVIDANIVWDVVEDGLPPLMEAVRELLSSD